MNGTLSLDGISSEESHRLIDEAFAGHQASIVALKTQKNSLAPISRLPPEILYRIFFLVKEEVQSQNMLPYSLQWIEVTHVNSHWRLVAINSPSLWVDPPLTNLRWVEEMLKRSKDAGLVIKLYAISTITPALKLVLKHSSRIKHLSVQYMRDASVWNDLQMELPKFAPWLEHFSFAGVENNVMFGVMNHAPLVISEDIFCETGRLRYLRLSECDPNWNSHPSLLRSLTHLTLHDLTLDCRPTGKQFMDALKGMPDLEVLDIENAFPVEQTWDSEQIHFASLQALYVQSVRLEVETFLRCVTFPPAAKVKVGCIVDTTSTSYVDSSGIISNLSRSYSKTVSAFHTLLPSSLGDCVGIRLFGAPIADKQIIDYCSITADLELTFSWMTILPKLQSQYIANITTNIFSSAMLLPNVPLHLDMRRIGLSAEAVANTFGILPQVRSVLVGGYASHIFFKVLQLGSYPEDVRSTGDKLYFPNLSSIYFYKTTFWSSCVSELMEHETSISVALLKNCLTWRSESGARVEKLTLEYCRKLRKHDVHSLLQVVDEIDWDQRELDSDSEDDYDEEEEDEDYEDEEIYTDDYDDYEEPGSPLDW